MERIDTTTPHGEYTTIPTVQFLILMYDMAETMADMDDNKRDADWYIDEAEEILVRNGILKGE